MVEPSSLQMIIHDQLTIPAKLLTNYTDFGLDERDVLLLLLLMRYSKDKNAFPTPSQLAGHLTINEKQCSEILMKLIQKGLVEIKQEENEAQQISEQYSLDPLLKKLYMEKAPEPEEETNTIGTIFILFEQEFARPLSPFEIETINAWLDEDQFTPALIKAALRESVLMAKLNFKYIDRILREWKKKGIQTVEQAREATKQFHNQKSRYTPTNNNNNTTKKRDTSIYYNWLEGENS